MWAAKAQCLAREIAPLAGAPAGFAASQSWFEGFIERNKDIVDLEAPHAMAKNRLSALTGDVATNWIKLLSDACLRCVLMP